MATVHAGADIQLVALYPGGAIRTGDIGELTDVAADYATAPETATDGLPVKIYYRSGNDLVETNTFAKAYRQEDGSKFLTMQVVRISPGYRTVAFATAAY